ncbi:MAG: transposase [Proteobacteria bacterium]|nr:transposase [Pseudomonadota bacterium]
MRFYTPYRDDLVVAAECIFTWYGLADLCAAEGIAVDLALLDRYDTLLTDLESYLVRQAKQHDAQAFHLLRSIPGVGKVLALTILYEIHTVQRFDRVQELATGP